MNPGWRATLDGAPLEPVVLDGWQQGYRIPAGSAGDVVIEFAPDPWYRGALLGGLVLAVALLALATAGVRRPRSLTAASCPVSLASPAPRPGGRHRARGAGWPGWCWAASRWPSAGPPASCRRSAGTPTGLGVVALVASGVLVATSAGLDAGGPGPGPMPLPPSVSGCCWRRSCAVRRARIAGWRRDGGSDDRATRHGPGEVPMAAGPVLLAGAALIVLQTIVRAGSSCRRTTGPTTSCTWDWPAGSV